MPPFPWPHSDLTLEMPHYFPKAHIEDFEGQYKNENSFTRPCE